MTILARRADIVSGRERGGGGSERQLILDGNTYFSDPNKIFHPAPVFLPSRHFALTAFVCRVLCAGQSVKLEALAIKRSTANKPRRI